MIIEKVICPICHKPMKKSKKKQIFETAIRDKEIFGARETTSASFFFCWNCNNVQTFLELGEGLEEK
jgi:hypothetical protein